MTGKRRDIHIQTNYTRHCFEWQRVVRVLVRVRARVMYVGIRDRVRVRVSVGVRELGPGGRPGGEGGPGPIYGEVFNMLESRLVSRPN